jgi:hypothetical protein
MRQWTALIVASLVLLSGCNSKKPNETKLRSAIDQYLLTQTRTCVAVDGKLPLDVPAGDKSGEGARLAALEHGGLLQSTNATAVVQSMANALSLSPKKPELVKRYTISSEGQKYFQRVQGTFGQPDGFCYGHEKVSSIVNWTEPQTQGDYTETTVTYTANVPDFAAWAKLPEVNQAFPSISGMLAAAGKNQKIPLQLTNNGWVVKSF